MKAFFKRIKVDFLLSSLLCILLGITFIIWNGQVIDVIGTVLSVGLLVVGIIFVLGYFSKLMESVPAILAGIIFVALGAWFLIEPARIFTLIPIVIGLVLLFHGIRGVTESLAAKTYGLGCWGVNFLLSAVNVVLGIICIIFSTKIIETAAIFVGIILIYNGLSNIWIIASGSRAKRMYDKTLGVIDVEVIEEKDK